MNANHYHRTRAYLTKGVGAQKNEEQALSVQGQVQRLIEEATAIENLAQMYIGEQLFDKRETDMCGLMQVLVVKVGKRGCDVQSMNIRITLNAITYFKYQNTLHC